jgi:hypothetical protein
MTNLKNLFIDIKKLKYDNNCKMAFETIKLLLIQNLEETIKNKKKSNAGRKMTTSLNTFLNAVFAVANDGIKTTNISQYFNIPKATFMRYNKILMENNIFENFYKNNFSRDDMCINNLLMTDSFTVKSLDGNEQVGPNSTDRGRNGIKVSVICDFNYLITNIHVDKANNHDTKLLKKTLTAKFEKRKRMLADAAYVGKNMKEFCKENNCRLIAKPRYKRNKKLTHYLKSTDHKEINYRWRIEKLFGMLRRFRGINLKYTKKILSYVSYLYLAIICITCCIKYIF